MDRRRNAGWTVVWLACLAWMFAAAPALAQDGARIDPLASRVDVSAMAATFDATEALPEMPQGAPGTFWFYVDLVNPSNEDQSRIVRFSAHGPGRFALLGGAAKHEILRVFVSGQGEVPLLRGLSGPAIRAYMPASSVTTVAYEVRDPSGEAGVEVWGEGELLMAERGAQFRTTLLAGILVAAAAYLLALWSANHSPTVGAAFGCLAMALLTLLTHARVFTDAPLGLFTADGLTAAGLAASAAFGVIYLRRALKLAKTDPEAEKWGRIVLYVLAAAALPPLAAIPGARTLTIALVLAAFSAACVALMRAYRRRSDIAIRHMPAMGAIALSIVVAALYMQWLSQFWPGFDAWISGGFTIGLALLAFAAGPIGRARTVTASSSMGSGAPPMTALPMGAGDTEGRYALALAAAYQGLWDWDIDRDRLSTSATVAQLLGLSPEDLKGPERNWSQRIHPDDRDVYENALGAYRAKGNVAFQIEFRMRHADGNYRWIQLRASCIAESGGEASRCVGVVTDISARKAHEHRLVHDTLHDGLTGLPNRALLLDRLQRLVDAKRRGAPERGALIVMDLDRFKTVNDGLGHVAGDVLLIAIAKDLEKQLRPEDSLARIGGDEFALLVEGTAADDAAARARALQEAIAAPHEIDGSDVFATASLGVTMLRSEHEFAEDLLREAEIAMYRAKSSGGARVEVFNPAMGSSAPDRLKLENDLRRALERGELDIHVQPIVTLKSGETQGFEALLRWHHPERGLLSADDFLPLAEETGLIRDFGRFAVARAAEELASMQKGFARDNPVFICVNISSRELLTPEFAEMVESAINGHAIAPGTLKLEITESTMMANPETALLVLEQLKKLGAGLALDDFGTGFSSLSYLQRYPFDTIKIDKSFVAALDTPGESRAIIRTILGLARDLRLTVIAEGVESEKTARQLLKLGCEYAQGFFYGVPTTLASMRETLMPAPQAEDSVPQADEPTPEPAPLPTALEEVEAALKEEPPLDGDDDAVAETASAMPEADADAPPVMDEEEVKAAAKSASEP